MNIISRLLNLSKGLSFKLPASILLVGVTLFQPQPVNANDTLFLDKVIAREDITVTSDVWFGDGNLDESLPFFLDVYQPSSPLLPAELPALVYVHGGAFTQGDKADQPAPLYSYEFAQRGYVVFSINYTLDGTPEPATIDAAAAVRWLRENSDTYGVDSERIIIGGHSAGSVTSIRVGVFEADDLGGEGAEVAAVLAAAGTINNFEELDINDAPMFIINGTLDMLASVENSRALISILDNLADSEGNPYPYSYMEVEGAGHSFLPGTGTGRTLPLIVASPQDAVQGWSNTEIDGKTIEQHCFEFFYEHLNLADQGESGLSESQFQISQGVSFSIGNDGSSDYLFTWSDGVDTWMDVIDPYLFLTVGQTYTFQRTSNAHPFLITTSGLDVDTSGGHERYTRTSLSDSGDEIQPFILGFDALGIAPADPGNFRADPAPTLDFITWTPSADQVGNYFYTCEVEGHLGMTGGITVLPQNQTIVGEKPDDVITLPMYRFDRKDNGGHFFTASMSERDAIVDAFPPDVWIEEGPVFEVLGSTENNAKPVYRLFNSNSGEHLYTISEDERLYILSNFPEFSEEGIAFYAHTQRMPGTVPVYRFYNKGSGGYFYTISTSERDTIITRQSDRYAWEGVAFHGYSVSQ